MTLVNLLRRAATPLAILALAGCMGSGGDQGASAAAKDPDVQSMERGLAELNAGTPAGAEAHFREILGRTPTHYGASYQLAVALDRGGKPAEARRQWEQVRSAAEAISDSATLRTARTRLAAPDTSSQEATMALGLDLLYRQNNASGAAAEFRKVLQRNATHYGATYQLATALDRLGQRAQARPLWEKTLGMAVSYKDEKTAAVARERLKS